MSLLYRVFCFEILPESDQMAEQNMRSSNIGIEIGRTAFADHLQAKADPGAKHAATASATPAQPAAAAPSAAPAKTNGHSLTRSSCDGLHFQSTTFNDIFSRVPWFLLDLNEVHLGQAKASLLYKIT